MADPRTDDDTYEPSKVEVNRSRQQGDGVGQKDLNRQRDPTGARSAEQFSRKSDSELDAEKKAGEQHP
jgi:hypothetical protein